MYKKYTWCNSCRRRIPFLLNDKGYGNIPKLCWRCKFKDEEIVKG